MFSKKINSIDSNKFIPDPKKEIRMASRAAYDESVIGADVAAGQPG